MGGGAVSDDDLLVLIQKLLVKHKLSVNISQISTCSSDSTSKQICG